MKTSYLFTFLCLVSLHVNAQTPTCAEWESRLKADINTANECEPKYQTCMGKGPANPMRELNYCQNLLRSCESMDAGIENEELKPQVEQYKKQCS